MVLVFLLHMAFTGVSILSDEELKEKKRLGFKLSKNDLELIEEIERIEIDLINKGINPDTLTLDQVKDYLKEEMKNDDSKSSKEKKYKKLQEKIQKLYQTSD